MIYLASPYSHPDPEVMEARYNAVALCAAQCIAGGQNIFSPIVYGHVLHKINPTLGTTAETWRAFNMSMLRHASTVCVLQLVGWEESVGIAAEIAMATTLGIPVYFLNGSTTPPGLPR